MSTQSVTVLTPNGRRGTVKVTPNMTILEILEETCKKFKFSPNDYDLIHHKRILDLTAMFRFSGLPNNAQLEMMEAKVPRKEEDVVLCLQLEDGSRFTENFKPSTLLVDILKKLSPESLNDDTVVIYMRTEIYGNSLSTTTLKNLGLTGGRAILRVIHKKPEELKMQANVSSILIAKRDVETTLQHIKPESSSQSDDNVKDVDSEKAKQTHKVDTLQIDPNDKGHKLNEPILSQESKKSKIDELQSSFGEEDEEVIPEPIEIGERHAILYSLDSMKVEGLDFPDSFYDVTVEDVKKLLRELKQHSNELEDAPLMTSKLRELEENKKILRHLTEYKTTIIRIQFPNRLILQGVFNPIDTIDQVMDFVRKFLKNSEIDFHLFLTPPKTILNGESRLIEINCVPQALIHFGVDKSEYNENFLKEEYLEKLSMPKSAVMAALKSRGLSISQNKTHNVEASSSSVEMMKTESYGEEEQRKMDRSENTGAVKKVPKWFKTGGK